MEHFALYPLVASLIRWVGRHSRAAALLLMAVVLAVYALAFRPLYAVLGPSAASVAALPVTLIAWLFGAKAGIVTGVAATLLSVALMLAVGETDLPYILQRGGATGFGVLFLVSIVVGVVSDLRSNLRAELSARRQAEERLASERLLLRTVIDNLPPAIYAKDLQGRKTLTNPADLAWMGAKDESEVLGKTDAEIFDDKAAEAFLDHDSQLFSGQKSIIHDERWLPHPSGGLAYVMASKVHLLGPDGEITGLVGVTQDITERKLAEEALLESEERMRRLAESADAILWQYDIGADRWTYVAPQAARILGYPPDAWTDMAFWSGHLHPEDRDWAVQYCAECTAQGRDHEFEYRFLAADGRTVWIRDVVSVEMRDGQPALLHGFMLDISEQKAGREALLNERTLLRTVIDHLPMAVYAKDLEGRKTLTNRLDMAFVAATSSNEMEGKTDSEVYPAELAERFAAEDRQVLETGQPLIVEETIAEWPSGRQDWVSFAKIPLRDAQGRVAGLVGITQDISERKRAERVLSESEKRARRQRAALAGLAVDPVLLGGDLPQTMTRLAETVGRAVAVERAGVWLLASDDSTLRCVALFQDGQLQPTEGLEIRVADYPAYFAAMRSRRQIFTQDARVDERTRALSEAYLEPLGIVSLLEAGIQVDGQLVGVISCEHQGEPRAWHPDEEAFASTAAALAAQIVVSAQRRDAELALRESEDRYLRVADNAPDLIYHYRLKPEPGFTYVSPAATKLVGYTPEEHYADPSLGFRLVHPEDRALLEAMSRGDGADGEPVTLRWIHKEGHVVWVEQRNVTICDDTGTAIAIEGIARDVTKRKRAEDALAQERQLLRTVIDNLPASVYAKDLEGRKTLANPANLAILGASTEVEVLGKTDRDFYPAEIAARFEANDRHVFTTGLPTLNKEHALSGQDNTRWVMTSKLPLRDATGEIVGLVGITYDITERKKAERERLQTERQLLHIQKLESLGVLAGGVAHDFNNLLMAIMGNLTLALPDLPESSRACESVLLALKAGQRAADVARQLLTYSGGGRVHREPIDLSGIVQENAEILRVAISKTVNLSLELEHGMPAIDADSGQIQQVVINLITNASEAIGEDRGNIVLRTGVHAFDDAYLAQSILPTKPPPGTYVYLEVSDTGCGMEPETVQRLFEPFFSTKSLGRGLGMAAVQGIVSGHRGAIMVQSAPGEGSTIRVLFPIVENDDSDQGNGSSASASRPRQLSAVPIHGATVLVVDDEYIVRQAAQKLLQRLGYRTLAAENGEQALAVYLEHAGEIDCVLLDLTMPRMDGAATFAALHELAPEIPVVLCSGYSEHESRHRFDKDTLAGFIQKPYSIELLSEIIQEALALELR